MGPLLLRENRVCVTVGHLWVNRPAVNTENLGFGFPFNLKLGCTGITVYYLPNIKSF